MTIGVPLAAASRTHSATCSVVRGKTTADGRILQRRGAVEAVRNEILRARQDRVGADDGRETVNDRVRRRHEIASKRSR